MKRLIALILIFLMVFVACQGDGKNSKLPDDENIIVGEGKTGEDKISQGEEEQEIKEEDEKIRLMALKGPTSMGLVKVLEDYKDKIDFQMVHSGDEILVKLVNDEVDLAAVPVNMASIVYNKSKNIKLVSTNTMGVLYVVSTDDSIKNLEDLRGKTIMSTGQGTVPEWTLKSLLEWRGIPVDEVNIQWKTEPTEITGILAKNGGIALLPEPFVTVARTKVEGLNVSLNLTKMWEESFGLEPVTGVLLASNKFIEERKDDLDAFLDAYKASIEFVNSNHTQGAKLIEKYDIVPAKVAELAISNCNLRFTEGKEMQGMVSAFLETLGDQDLKSIGGELPGEDFYYKR